MCHLCLLVLSATAAFCPFLNCELQYVKKMIYIFDKMANTSSPEIKASGLASDNKSLNVLPVNVLL